MYRIEKLSRQHGLESFDCGVPQLNTFLARHAMANQTANASQTYVGLKENQVIGFYSLAAAEVKFEDAPERLRKGLARHPVPCILLARLGIDLSHQGLGAGSGLLKDAFRKTHLLAEIAGARALVVHAKDEKAKAFYQRYGLADGLVNPLHLYALTKDLLRAASV